MTNITLAEKIAAVERAISDWDGCSIDRRSRDVSVLEAVLADLRATENMHLSDATQIIAKEYARDIVGEHEMGMRIMGEQFAKRLLAALSASGFAIRALPVE